MGFALATDGAKQLDAKLEDVKARAAEALRAGVYVVAQTIMDVAIANAPHVSGRLRASAYVTRADPVVLGFAADYAGEIHELPRAHRNGKSKFLAAALTPPGIAESIAAATARALEAGTTLANAPGHHPTRGNPGASTGRRRTPARRRR